MADWSMWARDAAYGLDLELPITSARAVRRWLGVDTAIIETPFTPEAMDRLQPSHGVELWRDGRQEFAGLVEELNPTWSAETGEAVLKASCVGDAVHLADRLVFPDPLRAADDQTVNDHWTTSGVASTAMQQLISDQAGPTCRADRRVPGLALGADPGVGVSRPWSGLFNSVLQQLTLMSVVSGANLGVRMRAAPGQLTADVVAPRNLADDIRFSADLSNLAGIDYRITAPSLTHALAAGQGDLRLRLRRLAVTSDPLALAWGRQIWSYIDRRDTAEVAELVQAAEDALADGGPTVSLAVTLLDTDAATYGRDWDVGDLVTVYVGLPGQTKVATVSDVIREIRLDVAASGAESIRPAIGSYDAKATVPTPTQQQLAAVGLSLAGLITRK
ncbi:siphovirus ReqiPepy6 Gp37-like family protein [Blastococcus sp. CCUG 61487]|uniref:Gp37-like protein n=1 Tax=Blastococcus sp. CCUG 61487 TaxID=1840703 RepID=UPI0010BFFB53|nr:siphovirus ReqiPepy6 Gp37-like family protein [Blastococcus sp. CCUG 61487]TKJ24370.1 hypothetical protein A6V29_05065 [Blastococcus sp. CCUG 61487]